ncbi:MAG: PilZ domain-containing protein [Deltaproteobacteria bacterium]|nr:PilZ domain-containing protein [Deltaproteobacteria bacterium]
MSKKENQDKYQQIVESEESIRLSEERERRSNPRFKLDSTELSLSITLNVSTIDVSVEGLAFYSTHAFQIGQRFSIQVGQVFSIEAEVIACDVEEIDPDLLEMRYRVNCHYVEQEGGRELLVLLKEMGKQEVAAQQ